MSKNIVICCDGTNNKLTIYQNTNVIHLYSCLKINEDQVAYYSPGVGTIVPDGIKAWFSRLWYRVRDLMGGSSLHGNVIDAYIFLMNNYQDGDRIYLFGFSRGAYTVRMLSGIIEMFGLLHAGNTNHLRYILEVYMKSKDKVESKDNEEDKNKPKTMFAIARTFKARFSRSIKIEFIGVWDTVVAMGGLFRPYKSFPYYRQLNIAKHIRHAVAIDERRKHFDYSPVTHKDKEVKDRDLKEVFFAGVHSDIGGGYPEEGLSKICLEWMLGEAINCGLLVDNAKVLKRVYNELSPPDITSAIHNTSTFWYKFSDFIPRWRFNSEKKKRYLDFRLWPLRKIEKGRMLHASVFEKIARDETYKPKNLAYNKEEYIIESTHLPPDIK